MGISTSSLICKVVNNRFISLIEKYWIANIKIIIGKINIKIIGIIILNAIYLFKFLSPFNTTLHYFKIFFIDSLVIFLEDNTLGLFFKYSLAS